MLNGTSSAGKTTLAKALQRRLPDPLLAVGIDTVVYALPGRWLVPPGWHEVFRYDGEGDSLPARGVDLTGQSRPAAFSARYASATWEAKVSAGASITVTDRRLSWAVTRRRSASARSAAAAW